MVIVNVQVRAVGSEPCQLFWTNKQQHTHITYIHTHSHNTHIHTTHALHICTQHTCTQRTRHMYMHIVHTHIHACTHTEAWAGLLSQSNLNCPWKLPKPTLSTSRPRPVFGAGLRASQAPLGCLFWTTRGYHHLVCQRLVLASTPRLKGSLYRAQQVSDGKQGTFHRGCLSGAGRTHAGLPPAVQSDRGTLCPSLPPSLCLSPSFSFPLSPSLSLSVCLSLLSLCTRACKSWKARWPARALPLSLVSGAAQHPGWLCT